MASASELLVVDSGRRTHALRRNFDGFSLHLDPLFHRADLQDNVLRESFTGSERHHSSPGLKTFDGGFQGVAPRGQTRKRVATLEIRDCRFGS
jgi:hypothetical protein